MNNGKVSFVVRIAVFSLLLTLQYGCGGDKKQAAEGKASAGPAKAEKASQPKGQAPEAAPKAVAKSTPKEAEAAPAPKKSAVETAKDALKAGDVTVASKALQTLREYIDKTPTASDLGDAAKLLTNESIERASRLLAENKVKEAHTAIRLILDNNGELVSGVAKGLVMGREASAKVARFILSATLDDLVALREAAKAEGALGTAAARVLKHVEQPIRAFVKQRFKTVVERDQAVAAVFPNGEGLCKAARDANDATKCEAKFFGLSGADEIKAVPANLLALLRVATLARGMGETLAGLEELPMAKSQAADIPAKTSENSLRLPGVVLTLDAAGVQVSTRSYVDLSTGKVTGPVLPGKVVMTTDALAAADTPDAMAGLVASLNAVKASGSEVEKALYGDQSPNRPDTKNGSLIFDVAAGVPMAVTRKVLAAANSAGYSDIRYRRGAEERNCLLSPPAGL